MVNELILGEKNGYWNHIGKVQIESLVFNFEYIITDLLFFPIVFVFWMSV